MKLQIENTISRIADKARGRFGKLLRNARSQTENAADAVSKGKGTVKAVSQFSLKLSATTHKTADKILRQQARLVENQIDAFAGRLHAAASATNLRNLVDTQIRLIPKNASRLVGDARETLAIIAGAGQEVQSLVKGTVAELRGVSKPVAKKAAAKKTTASKPAGKKKTTKVSKKKAVAKKAVAKKAAPKAAATMATTAVEKQAA